MQDAAKAPEPDHVARIIGVYDADGSVLGELSYFLRARVGRAHCALCDVTHGRVRERREWREAQIRLPAPFVTFHRDDQPVEVRAAGGGRLPVVLAETGIGRLVVLLDADELARCAGDPGRLVDAISGACADHGLLPAVGDTGALEP